MAIKIEAVYGIELNNDEKEILSQIDDELEMFVTVDYSDYDYIDQALGVHLGYNVYDPLHLYNIQDTIKEAEEKVQSWLNQKHDNEIVNEVIQKIKQRHEQDNKLGLLIYSQNI